MNQARSTSHQDTDLPDDVVLSVRGVSKKFCRNLRRSMWYGMQDLGRNLLGIRPRGGVRSKELRVTGNTSSSPVTHHSSLVTSHSSLPPLRRDEFWALQDINFDLKRGEVLGLIGPNGSGKSTLLRLLTGIFPPDAGEISVRGRVGALIALGAGFHPHMTGRENIYLNGTILGLTREEIEHSFDSIVDFAEIGDFIDAPVATYSSGMTVRLGFAVSTAMKPDLLLVDEVLAVGDLRFTLKCLNRIYELIKTSAVVFVSHNMEMVSLISTTIMILDHGRTVCYEKTPALGIDFYYRHFSGQRKAGESGSGMAKLHSLHFICDGRKVAADGIPTVPHGGELAVELDVSFLRRVSKPLICLLVSGKEPREIVDLSSQTANVSLDGDVGRRRVRMVWPNVCLNCGVYSIAVCISDIGTREVLYRVDDAAKFSVGFKVTSWAPLVPNVPWTSEVIVGEDGVVSD